VLLLANFPRDGKSRILASRTAEEKGDLKPLLKAQVSWIVARQDRAWYAAGEARKRLHKLGWKDEQVYQLDGDWKDFSAAERAQFRLAEKLAASPIVLTDNEVNEALKQTSPREVVQLISYVTGRTFFNRVTEAAGLKLEE
jgi:alkylhydroperoxidase family enzyme